MRAGSLAFRAGSRHRTQTGGEAILSTASQRLRLLAAALATLIVSACTAFPTLAERTALLAPTLEYYAPEPGGGPAPLVILVSGCGGLNGLQGPKTVMKNYAGAATRAGAYAVVMDSFASRGIPFDDAVSTVCSGLRLHGNERAGDIIATEALARAHWNVDFSGVILAGWSHGGWAVMELLSAGPRATNIAGFRIDQPSPALTPDAVALFYPYCGFLNATGRSTWDFKGPLLYLNASTNAPAAGRECTDAILRARGGGEGLRQVDYPNTHAFDEEDQVPGSEFIYDPEATQRALALFEGFIRDQATRLR
jgi:dienelactone hydrolase